MIESFIKTAIETLFTAGGTGWAVSVIIGIWAYILDARVHTVQENAKAAVAEQYEKRLVEFRNIVEAISASTNTITTLQGSVSSSAETTNQLAVAFTKLLREYEVQHEKWDDRGASIHKQLEDVQRRLENLQRKAA
jgi:type II secretory pathway component PulM